MGSVSKDTHSINKSKGACEPPSNAIVSILHTSPFMSIFHFSAEPGLARQLEICIAWQSVIWNRLSYSNRIINRFKTFSVLKLLCKHKLCLRNSLSLQCYLFFLAWKLYCLLLVSHSEGTVTISLRLRSLQRQKSGTAIPLIPYRGSLV